jgi:hypothetical protein
MNLPNPMYVHSGELNVNARYSGKQTAWDKNVMYSMHIYDRNLDTKFPPLQGGL